MVSFQTKDLKLSYTKITSIRLLSQLKNHVKGELFPLRNVSNLKRATKCG